MYYDVHIECDLLLSFSHCQDAQRGSFFTGATMSMKMSPVIPMQGVYGWQCSL